MSEDRATKARVVGTTLLLAGSCIGAGMLAMPVITGLAGFMPAVVTFIVCWAFMTTTALLLLEVNIWLGTEVSIVTMAGRTLGNIGRILSWVLFCYLFYLLLVSYSAEIGHLVTEFIEDYTGLIVPTWVGSLVCTVVAGILVFWGTGPVDYVNRALMVGLIVTYFLLVGLGLPRVRETMLNHIDWKFSLLSTPIVVISFGLHNMVPTVTRYLSGNMKKLRLCIILGTTVPLVIYLLWELVILGIVPAEEFEAIKMSGGSAASALRAVVGKDWVSVVTQYFAFFAITTSFLAQALSLLHFLSDGLHAADRPLPRFGLTLLAIVPPFVAALYNPAIFIEAIMLAGAYGAVILFGILPALMAWVARYRQRSEHERVIGGGRPVLVIVILFSCLVIAVEVLYQLGVL